jgi:hypothetical protein
MRTSSCHFPLTFSVFLAGVLSACLTDNPEPRYPVQEPATATKPARPKAEAAPGPAKTCPGGTRRASDGLIDDFEDGNGQLALLGGRDGYWWVAKADHATVTLPASGFSPSDGGADGSATAARFVGRTDHRDQWGAAMGVNFLASGFYDASKYAGVGFAIKASQPSVNVRVKLPDVSSHPEGSVCSAECWNSFGRELIVGTEWTKLSFTWSELSQQSDWGIPRPPSVTPAKLKNIEWAVYPGVEFDVTIDDVHFVECE